MGQARAVQMLLFDEVADALRSLLPTTLGSLRCRARRYGIKVWFDEAAPPREHYEAQVINGRYIDDSTTVALEVGFHTEHPSVADNDATIARLVAGERAWRRRLGAEAVVGPFLGRPGDWRRISEAWPDPDLDDPGLGLAVATRLTDYVTALEPLRRARPSRS